jgi:hypothetical protein
VKHSQLSRGEKQASSSFETGIGGTKPGSSLSRLRHFVG